MDEVTLEAITEATHRLHGLVRHTPLRHNAELSRRYGAHVYLKREDLQPIRSYKIRGAFNLLSMLSEDERRRGVVTASAGNHSQAVAYSCDRLGIDAVIYMPRTTSSQKRENTERFGNGRVTIRLVGDTFDEAYEEALAFSKSNGHIFVHPFDDPRVIAGQGTIGVELLESDFKDLKGGIDYLVVPIGGGGLISGIGTYFNHQSPHTRIIGVEPEEAPAMYRSLEAGKIVELDKFSHFIDGVAVKHVGDLTFAIARKLGYRVTLVPEGRVCTTLVDLYNNGIVAELAGAVSIAALPDLKDEIKGKNIVCILSGGNNDFTRLAEIHERSQIHEGLLHYFMIEFPQRPGALRQFLERALGPNDDIVHFNYTKKTSAEHGPALVGVQLTKKEDYEPLLARFKAVGFAFEEVSTNPLFQRYFI